MLRNLRKRCAALSASMLGIAVALGLAACGGGGLGDCPPASTSQQISGAMVLDLTCGGCHHSALQGADRRDAPAGMDFDKPDVVLELADDIYSTADEGSMPPPTSDVPRLSDAQVENLRIYLACTAAAE